VGLISGLTFGMLFAPTEGKKLRKELKKGAGKSGSEALATLVDAFKDAGTEAMDEMKKLSESEQMQAALSMSKDKMREYLSNLEETGYDIAARAQEKLEELSDAAQETGKSFKKRAVRKQGVVKKVLKKKVAKVKKEVSAKVTSVSKKKPAKKAAIKKSAPKAASKRATTKKSTIKEAVAKKK